MTVSRLEDLPSLAGTELLGAWLRIDIGRERKFYEGAYLDLTYGADRGPGYPDGLVEGFHLVALLDHLSAQLLGRFYGFNYGLERVRFVSPVTVDDQVRLRLLVAEVTPRDDGFLVTYDCTLEVEGRDRPGMVARWLVLLLPQPEGEDG